MAGILDGKERILDTFITNEGRRQLAKGEIQIQFASFTDGHTFYQGSVTEGSENPDARIFLEATSRRQDQITFETDDAGILVPFFGSDLSLVGGTIFSGSTTAITGTAFASLSAKLLESSITNFDNLQIIGTRDFFDEEADFTIGPVTASFDISSKIPINTETTPYETSIDNIEPFFQDKRLQHILNYQVLPPVNRIDGTTLGNYEIENPVPPTTYSDLSAEIEGKPEATFTFTNTSKSNNFVSQIFHVTSGEMTKLDIIDFGEFVTDAEARTNKQVYFVGKVYQNSRGISSFVNIFTIVFD